MSSEAQLELIRNIGSYIAAIGVIILGVVQFRSLRLQKDTHALVNSNYGASLLATLRALEHVWRLTDDPEAKRAAWAAVVEAQRLYDDHIAKQNVVDSTATENP